MPDTVRLIRVFVASPGDLADERSIVGEVIDHLNEAVLLGDNVKVELMRWETHAWPGFGDDAQSVINKQIGPYDVFVGIMWNRIGSPTGRAISGTVEEFERAYRAWKEHKRPSLMFYFNRCPSDLATLDELAQKAEVIKFKTALKDLGALYWEYNGAADFRKMLSVHLVKELKIHTGGRENRTSPPNAPEDLTNADNWPSLLKIGSWRLDASRSVVHGGGVYDFLLSHNVYGSRNFRIKANVAFMNYSQFQDAGMDTANAGIVFGWQDDSRGHRYYNLLFSGERLLLEAVGFTSGDDYRDFKHFDEGVAFKIVEGFGYDIAISVTETVIDVFIENVLRYSVSAPVPLLGRVGLRPWRAQIQCSKFVISES